MSFHKWYVLAPLLRHLKVWFILKSDDIIPVINHCSFNAQNHTLNIYKK
jgi:hypothetical protein